MRMFSTYMKLEDESIPLDDEVTEPPAPLHFPEYDEFAERIRKTLYYGSMPSEERPSLPMSEIAVGFFRDAAPKELGKADLYWAADVGSKAFISPCSMMLSMIYIERLKHKNPEYLLTTSSSDLFLISMMVASKFLYDEGVDEEVYNEEWAESAAMETSDVNQLERDFLQAIDWSLFAEKEDFERVLASMEERIAMSQGLDRGSWSYSDLLVLLSNTKLQDKLRHILEEALKVMLVCSVAYTAGGGTILASVATVTALKGHVTLLMPRLEPIYHGMPQGDVSSSPNGLELQSINNISSAIETELDHNTSWMNRDVKDTFIEKDSLSIKSVVTGEISLTNKSSLGDVDSVANEYRVAMHSGLSFPGFLTLALIKDTVSHIFGRDSGLTDGKMENVNVDMDTTEKRKPPCNCPACPLLAKGSFRRRKWVKGQQMQNRSNFLQCLVIPPLGFWGSLIHRRKGVCCCGNIGGQVNMRETTGNRKRGSGNSGNQGLNVEDEGDSIEGTGAGSYGFNKPGLREMVREGGMERGLSGESHWVRGVNNNKEKCEVKREGKWTDRVLLPGRVQTDYIELTSRLETSAHFAITR